MRVGNSSENEKDDLKRELGAATKVVQALKGATWDEVIDGTIIVGEHSWKRIQAALEGYETFLKENR